MGQKQKREKIKGVTGLGRITREHREQWNQMTALRFQTGREMGRGERGTHARKRAQAHAHTHTHARIHTHTLSLSLFLQSDKERVTVGNYTAERHESAPATETTSTPPDRQKHSQRHNTQSSSFERTDDLQPLPRCKTGVTVVLSSFLWDRG